MKVRVVGAVWAVAGVSIILGGAIGRVWPLALDALRLGLTGWQWIILIIWTAFMLISEGYRGFQQQFAPRFVARAWYLLQHGRTRDLILAPLFCMGYYGSTTRRIITSWSVTAGIVLLIIGVHRIPQPWRGIIDTGVVLGLVYGLVAIYVLAIKTVVSGGTSVNPEIKTQAH